MTADLFWYGAPELAAAYRRKDELEQQRKSNDSWLLGAYIYDAVGVVVGNALRKKGQQKQGYLDEPYRVIPKTEEEKQADVMRERQRVIDYFNRMEENSKRSR